MPMQPPMCLRTNIHSIQYIQFKYLRSVTGSYIDRDAEKEKDKEGKKERKNTKDTQETQQTHSNAAVK
jgi:hypothetical protein